VADELELSDLVAAIADNAPFDWHAERPGLSASNLDALRQLKIIQEIGAERRESPGFVDQDQALQLGWVYQLVIGLAAAKVIAATLGVAARSWSNPSLGPRSLIVVLFGMAGFALVAGGAKDRRGRALGALFVIIASAFADPFPGQPGGGIVDAAMAWLHRLPTDAFLALAFWQFANTFPGEPKNVRARRLANVFLVASATIGVVLFMENALRVSSVIGARSPVLGAALHLLDRDAPRLLYWPLMFTAAAPAIPYLFWKSRFEPLEERRRIAIFLFALAVGLAPMIIAVIATPFVPALRDPSRRVAIGWVLYTALISIVPSTIYAVMVQRIMDIRLVIQKTLQHTLARYAVWAASLGPLAYLALGVYLHRDMTVSHLIDRERPVAVLLMTLVGFGVLTFRDPLLRYVDNWFFRGRTDYVETLARVTRGFREARSVREITLLVTREIDRAIHASSVAVLLTSDDGSEFVSLDGTTRPLRRQSVLVELLGAVRSGIQLRPDPEGTIARLLPPSDRDWLLAEKVVLLVPMTGSTETILGVMAIGESRGGLPYTREDRMLVSAMGGHAAMLLENRWLRRSNDGEGPEAGRTPSSIDWENEAGAQCPECCTVWATHAATCSCGATTVSAVLPVIVNGKFRVQRLIGSGGMGVVYLAVDMALDRKVAIKTLPTMTPDRALRLHREARAMAAVLHPNLASIFGAEHWHGTPLLIVEYLEAGTLADRLRNGALAVEEVLDLGVVLADVLDRIHASGILHRDIKPSNIGYTRDGVPKLLDFGLAAIMDQSPNGLLASPLDASSVAELAEGSLSTATLITQHHQIVGTPLYLSPEALVGAMPQPSFDLWGLNLVLYEALAGLHPLGHGSVPEILRAIVRSAMPDVRDFRPDCPSAVAALLNDALSRVGSRRPASANDLRTSLRRLRVAIDSGRT
jgi:hypothetical protein